MAKGWRYESNRHSLAAKGVKTSDDNMAKAMAKAILRQQRAEAEERKPSNIVKKGVVITDIMSLEKKQELMNSTVDGFKSETISFTDLGYPDKKKFSVIIKGQEIGINVPEGVTTRELNKQYKGKTLS